MQRFISYGLGVTLSTATAVSGQTLPAQASLSGVTQQPVLPAIASLEQRPGTISYKPESLTLPQRSVLVALGKRSISTDLAERGYTVQVARGIGLVINLTGIGEGISKVWLSDPSRLVYSSQGSVIYLKPIQQLNFAGNTHSVDGSTMLTVVTQSGKVYQFRLVITASRPAYTALDVTHGNPMPSIPTVMTAQPTPLRKTKPPAPTMTVPTVSAQLPSAPQPTGQPTAWKPIQPLIAPPSGTPDPALPLEDSAPSSSADAPPQIAPVSPPPLKKTNTKKQTQQKSTQKSESIAPKFGWHPGLEESQRLSLSLGGQGLPIQPASGVDLPPKPEQEAIAQQPFPVKKTPPKPDAPLPEGQKQQLQALIQPQAEGVVKVFFSPAPEASLKQDTPVKFEPAAPIAAVIPPQKQALTIAPSAPPKANGSKTQPPRTSQSDLTLPPAVTTASPGTLANAISKGLPVAINQKQISRFSETFYQVQSAIRLLRRGSAKNLQEAAQLSGVKVAVLNQLHVWGTRR